MNKKVDTRIDYLDALRGVAVISVVAFHISGYFHNISTQNTLLKAFDWLLTGFVDWGRFGVVLFFLISGFIISNSLNKSPALSKFGLSRFFRLFPAYWLSLGILILLSVFFGTGEYPLEQIAANATMIPKLFHQKEMSGVFWTLFIELLFYFTIAIFFRLNLHNNAIVIGTSAIVLHLIAPIAILINHFLLLNIPVLYVFYHLSFLYAGNLLRIAIFEKRRSATYLSILFVFLVIFSTQLLSGVFSYQPNADKAGFVMLTPQATYLAYFLALITFLITIKYQLFKNGALVKVGHLSYSIYLLHMVVIDITAKLIYPEDIFSAIQFLLLLIAFIFMVSTVSFEYVEKPGVRLGRYVAKLTQSN